MIQSGNDRIDPGIRDAIRKSWDQSSVLYDSCPGHGIGTGEENVAWKQELNRNLPGPVRKVLDVGCGTGAMGLLFAEREIGSPLSIFRRRWL